MTDLEMERTEVLMTALFKNVDKTFLAELSSGDALLLQEAFSDFGRTIVVERFHRAVLESTD